MHELGIAEQLLSLTLRHAEDAGAEAVTRLNIVVGEFSSIVDSSLQFYWGMIAEGTIAEQAELHFTYIPGKLRCEGCGVEFLFREFDGACPSCGSVRVHMSDGDQFQLESIEIKGPGDHDDNPED
ncbi:MAG TPA: hydrogenase maturation nickel metallochaperone HypA [Aggregatilineales bacterium]|nr:hydrogenase maturation nickel metallochaperone HypA [Aggregatilineales bacterium]HPV08481.1 hydrogenase maturation nickel metallochaperone HypA [Aggregatilineales bacterium]HQA68193.1 hydrogenase maturation nickel metallochaperone HypA [Aggregatilineales bacterium]